jgi:cobaltochelatase CobS
MSSLPNQDIDEFVGTYERSNDAEREWWRVTRSERDNLYRIQHGAADAVGDIDTVVDGENLKAKLGKWQREGYARSDQADAANEARLNASFMGELGEMARAFAATAPDPGAGALRSPDSATLDAGPSVAIGGASLPRGSGGPLVPPLNPGYLFAARFDDVINDVTENRRIMLIGHTGTGKTSLIEQLAARAQQGVIRANMNGQATIGDFVGFWTVQGGQTVWVDGVLPLAMRAGLWLIIDEIDFAEPSVLAALTAVLEPGGKLMLKEKGHEIVAPHPAFRLFATANAVGAMSQFRHLYQGANLMNEAFLDRWRVYLFDYLLVEEETEVLMRALAPHITPGLARTLAAIAADCRAAFAREDLASAFSTRRLLDWATLMLRTGDPERAAGPTIYSKVSGEDAELIRTIMRQYIAPAA